MEPTDEFHLEPLPMEKEFRILSIRRRLKDLSRKDLEEFLTDALSTMAKLAHQVKQLSDYVNRIEGKNK